MLKTDVIQDVNSFQRLEAEWRELWGRLDSDAALFSSPDWYQVLWKQYFEKGRPFLVSVRDRGRLVGLAPLMRDRGVARGLPSRRIRFIENGNSLHNDFILASDLRGPALRAILEELKRWSGNWELLELKNIPTDSPNRNTLQEWLDRRKGQFICKPGLDSPKLSIAGSWDDFFASRSTRTRKTWRNIRNRFEKAGEWRIRHIVSFEDYQTCLDDILEVARNSWSEQAGDSLWSPGNRAFFFDLARVSAERGWLSVWLLYLRERPVAFEYHLRCGNTVHGLRASYHEEFAKLSPGVFLDHHILQSYFEDPAGPRLYDFGGSFDEYKKKWTEESKTHDWVYLFSGRPYGRLLKFLEGRAVPWAKSILKNRYKGKNGTAASGCPRQS